MKAKTILLGILMLLISEVDGFGEQGIRLTSGEWPPYTSEKLPGYGMLSQLVTEAFALGGISVDYTFFDSWKRSYILARQGSFDGSLTWARIPQREKDFHFSDPIAAHENVLFHMKSLSFDWQDFSDLKPFRVSVTSFYFYGDAFDSAVKKGDFTPFVVYRDIANFHNLFQGRTDLFPMDKKVGYYLLRSAFGREQQHMVTHHPKSMGQPSTCLVISKEIPRERSAMLIRVFNRGLARLKTNGRYLEILSGHGP